MYQYMIYHGSTYEKSMTVLCTYSSHMNTSYVMTATAA